jgi:hypothetical protein
MTFFKDIDVPSQVNIRCFKCNKDIDTDNQVYYVFLNKDNTDNAAYCTDCYLQDIADMKKLDPFLIAIYSKNFIRMNK